MMIKIEAPEQMRNLEKLYALLLLISQGFDSTITALLNITIIFVTYHFHNYINYTKANCTL